MTSGTSTAVLEDGVLPPGARPRSLRERGRRWRGLAPLPPACRPAGPHARLLLVLAALATLGVTAAGALSREDDVLATGVVAFLVFGLGTGPALLLRSAGTSTLVLAALAISCSASVLTGLAMAWTSHWHPGTAIVVAAALAAGWLLVELVRCARDVPGALGAARAALLGISRPAWVLAVSGATLTTLAAVEHSGESPTRGGLLTVVGPAWFLGVALMLAAALIATWTRRSPAVPLLLLSLPVVTAQAVVYRAPTVMVAARHVGVVQYITAHGSLDPTSDIYQAWAGIFAGVAWMDDAGRIGDPLTTVAAFAPIFLTAATVLAVRVLAGELGLSPTRSWWAAVVCALGSTLSQVYFSPQSLAFFLAVTVVALSLRAATARGRRRAGYVVLAMLLSCALAVTHEISPYLAAVALMALFLFRLVPSWPIAAVGVPAIAWALVNLDQVKRYFAPSAVGNVLSNVRPPSLSYNDYPESLTARLTYGLPAILLALIGLVALISWWRRRDRRSCALLVTAASPALLAFGSDYGQEVIFRVTLFALPWLAVAVALLRVPPQAGRVALAVGAVVLTAVNAYGMTGMDYARAIRAGEAAQLQQLERSAPPNSILFSLGTGAATPYRLTEHYLGMRYGVLVYHGTEADLPVAPTAAQARAAVDEAARVLLDVCSSSCYVDVSLAEAGYDDLYGIQRVADFTTYARAFAGSREWRAFSSGPDATIYELLP